MQRSVYIMSYDVADDKRRTRLFHYLRRWGDHLQYSVFRVVLSPADRERVRAAVTECIHQGEDQVLMVDLGPEPGRGARCVEAIGLPYTHPNRHAIIV